MDENDRVLNLFSEKTSAMAVYVEILLSLELEIYDLISSNSVQRRPRTQLQDEDPGEVFDRSLKIISHYLWSDDKAYSLCFFIVLYRIRCIGLIRPKCSPNYISLI